MYRKMFMTAFACLIFSNLNAQDLSLVGNMSITDDILRAIFSGEGSLELEYNGSHSDSHILLDMAANGQTNMLMTDASDLVTWKIAMNGGGGTASIFVISRDGSGANEFILSHNGDLSIRGDVTATSFIPTSDRNKKENFEEIDPNEVLTRVLAMPVNYWNYKTDNTSRHMGPVAQDFHAAFGLGRDDKGINVVDSAGVAFGAIQGMHQSFSKALDAKNARINELEQKLADQEARLAALEKLLQQ